MIKKERPSRGGRSLAFRERRQADGPPVPLSEGQAVDTPDGAALASNPFMKRLFLQLALLVFAAAAHCAEPARLLPKTNVLPLALDDAFQFRKTITFANDPRQWKSTAEDMVNFQRLRVNYGAVTGYDRQQRMGDYYTFYWRSTRAADLTIRFEYTQEKLGAF